jgi:LmbE family N-acetylglucosaminyl deacetylase
MNHRFPPLAARDALAGPVLALAAHPDDEVIGCGAMLAWHRHRGDAVTVLHVTDGAAGDPAQRFGDIAALRRGEGEEALRRLGVPAPRRLGLPDGRVPEHRDALRAGLGAALRELQPRTLYSFFFAESHRDHQAVADALVELAGELRRDCRVLLFGVNQPVPGGTLLDTTEFEPQKQHALRAYASQIAYHDFVAKIHARDRAATVNVEDPRVRSAEVFADLRPDELARARALAGPLLHLLAGGERG